MISFEIKVRAPKTSWESLSDVDPAMLKLWDKVFQSSGLSSNSSWLSHRLKAEFRNKYMHKYRGLISSVREALNVVHSTLIKPHMFILTDQDGVVLDLVGSKEIVSGMENYNIGIGTSFSMQHTGINAISVAMELESTTIIQAQEHHLNLFSDWSCICSPISVKDQILGYLNFSVSKKEDISFAVPLLEHIVERIEDDLSLKDPELNKTKIYKQLEKFGLTKREKEIGYLWLRNESIKEIASNLFISESTVRSVVKSIYKKTRVDGHVSYITKFLVRQ